MARRTGASTVTLTATAVVDHILGSLALFGALGLLAAVSSLPVWLRGAGTLAFAGSAATLVTLWLLRPREDTPSRAGVSWACWRACGAASSRWGARARSSCRSSSRRAV